MDDAISLGKLSLDAEIDLRKFTENVKEGKRQAGSFEDSLDALSAIADVAAHAVGTVRMSAGQGAESRATAEMIVTGVRGITDESIAAAREIDRVRITDRQAAESDAAGEIIKHNVKDIGDEADRTKRKLAEVRMAGGGGKSIGGTSLGLLGAAIGAGTLLAPSAGPGALGLLAILPTLFAGAGGAAGTLMLALGGVGKAIGGDKKAFDGLTPSAQNFVLTVRSLDGWIDKLKETASGNLFPGLERGLKDALSPGTVNAVSVAVAALAHALGLAGEEWGRYFGSAEFQSILGPLMQEGAKNIGLVSDTLLHLFDAIGVVARAGIPLTDWLMHAIDLGSKLADQWIHAKDASGGLAGAMNEAQTSLRLVAGLVLALLHAVGALGDALYPVSKIAVKDLTDGLNGLARLIEQNKTGIRDFVTGALDALVTVVGILVPIVVDLAKALGWVVDHMGGWKTAFEIIIGGFLAAKFLSLVGVVAQFTTGLGSARLAMLALSNPEVLAGIALVGGALYGLLDLMNNGATQQNVHGGTIVNDHGTQWFYPTGERGRKIPLADAIAQGLVSNGNSNGRGNNGDPHFAGRLPGQPVGKTRYSQSDVYQLLLANGVPSDVAANLARISAKGEDGSGNIAALNNNPATGDYSIGLFQENFIGQMGRNRVAKYAPTFGLSPSMSTQAFVKWLGQHPSAQAKIAYDIYSSSGYGAWSTAAGLGISDQGSPFGSQPAWSTNTGQMTAKQKAAAARRALAAKLQIPVTNDQTMVSHFKALAAAAGAGPAIERYVNDEIKWLKQENVDLEKSMQGKSALQKARIHGQIQKNEDEIAKLHAQVVQAIKMAADATEFKKFQSRMAELGQRFKADSAWASALTGAAAEKYQSILLGDLATQRKALEAEQSKLKTELATATGKRKTQLTSELAKVTSSLVSVNDQVLQSLEGVVQSMQSKESSVFSKVQAEFDQQFEQATQQLLDQAATRFFQNGVLTPEEQAYKAMIDADRQKSLQDALAAAKTPAEKAAAQRAIEEDHAQTLATESRRKADEAYAAAVKQIQAQRSKVEAQMNADLQKLSDGLLNGTASIGDLQAVADKYGIKIDKETIPDFDNLGAATNDLQAAFKALADFIYKLTGQKPPGSGSSSGSSRLNQHWSSFTGAGGVGSGGKLPSADMPAIGVSAAALAAVANGPYALRAAPNGMGDIVLMVDDEVLGRVSAKAIARSRSNVRVIAAPLKPALDRVTSVSS